LKPSRPLLTTNGGPYVKAADHLTQEGVNAFARRQQERVRQMQGGGFDLGKVVVFLPRQSEPEK
jgi:hypothetical protein